MVVWWGSAKGIILVQYCSSLTYVGLANEETIRLYNLYALLDNDVVVWRGGVGGCSRVAVIVEW